MKDQAAVKLQFDEVAQAYDWQRRKLIPCFDDFYNIAVSLAGLKTKSPTILDLGAGTGLFSSFLLQRYPKADLTLIDLSDKMLEIVKSRFKGWTNVNYIADDYTNYISNKQYDLIISALSIHHLTDTDKQMLYRTIHSNLKPTDYPNRKLNLLMKERKLIKCLLCKLNSIG